MALMYVRPAHLLVLDEPTDLDLATKEMPITALAHDEMLFVSHDWHFGGIVQPGVGTDA